MDLARGLGLKEVPGTDTGTAKRTWTIGEQQAHIHIHHKTSTILYIDIWTSSPGRNLRVSGVKTSVSALRIDTDSRAMAKIEE